MLKQFLFFCIFSFSAFLTYGQEISWMDPSQLNQALTEQPKNVFIDLTAKWCGWCKVMDKKTFSDPEVLSYVNQHFYAIKLDVDEDRAFEINGKTYSAKQLARDSGVAGLPSCLFLDKDFEDIKLSQGYIKPKQLLARLKSFQAR